MTTTHTAEEIITASQAHLNTLIGRNWPEISELLDESEEVTISAKIVITQRVPESGEHADKDNRVKTTISFTKKTSDSTESALGDPNQPELELGEEAERKGNGAPLDAGEAGDMPSEQRAVGMENLPGIAFISNEISISGQDRFMTEFLRSARGANWPAEAIDRVEGVLESCESIHEMEQVIAPYLFGSQPTNNLESEESGHDSGQRSAGSGNASTSLADVLHKAVADQKLPLVQVDFPRGYGAAKYIALFRKAARKVWPETAVDLLDLLARETAGSEDHPSGDGTKRALEVLRAHSERKPKKDAGAKADPDPNQAPEFVPPIPDGPLKGSQEDAQEDAAADDAGLATEPDLESEEDAHERHAAVF